MKTFGNFCARVEMECMAFEQSVNRKRIALQLGLINILYSD